MNTVEEDRDASIDERRSESWKRLSGLSSLESSKLGIVVEKFLCIPALPAVCRSKNE